MARGNSKLYRIREEYIKIIPKVSNYYVECAFNEGYMFVQQEGEDRVHMITSTCSMKSIEVAIVNLDIFMKDGSSREQRVLKR